MTSIDSKNSVKELVALDTQLINSDTTTVGNEINTQFFESLLFLLQAGVVTAGDVQFLIQHSDVSGSGFVDVPDDELIGTELLTNISASQGIARIGYIGKKQFVKVSVVTDNSANLTVGAAAILGSPRHAATS